MSKQRTFLDSARMTINDAVDLTAQSLTVYGSTHDVWVIAYSGGKDSTAMVTVLVWLIETGRVPRPKKLIVLYCDTRMELPPLEVCANKIMFELSRRSWIECRTVMAELDQRYMVYMLGRGVPPPNNNTLRWCTAQIKVEPMANALQSVRADAGQKLLMLIGVRLGESAARDGRIALACSKNGAECGQGWYQRDLPDAICDKLSPLLHWRTCLIWDWLMGAVDLPRLVDDEWGSLGGIGRKRRGLPPRPIFHGFSTQMVAEAYGLDEDGSNAELQTRTGCNGCPLATRDLAIENLQRNNPIKWRCLDPLKRLRPLYRELRLPQHRLRMPPGESRKDGTLSDNQNRMGPLTMKARLWALEQILAIQAEATVLAAEEGMPPVNMIDAVEEARIRELIAANTWPNKWSGDEPLADELYEIMHTDGSRQPLLPLEVAP